MINPNSFAVDRRIRLPRISTIGLFYAIFLFLLPSASLGGTVEFRDDFSDPAAVYLSREQTVPFIAPGCPPTCPPTIIQNPENSSTGVFEHITTGENANRFRIVHSHDRNRDADGGVLGEETLTGLFTGVYRDQPIFNHQTDGLATNLNLTVSADVDADRFESISIYMFNPTRPRVSRGWIGITPIVDSGQQTFSLEVSDGLDMLNEGGDVFVGVGFRSYADVVDDAVELPLFLDEFAVTIQTVPEPASSAMSGFGLIVLVISRRLNARRE